MHNQEDIFYQKFLNLFSSLGKPCVVQEIMNAITTDPVGTLIPNGSEINVSCNAGYHLVENTKQVCKNGHFSISNDVMSNVCRKS